MRQAIRSISRGALTAAALMGSCAVPALADSSVRAYAATSQIDTASGTVITRSTLLFRTGEDGTSLSVVNGDGASTPASIAFASDGEIEASQTDPAVTCYNMAAAVADAARNAKPATLYFGFDGAAVPVPVDVRSTTKREGSEDLRIDGRTDLSVPGTTGPVASDIAIAGDVERDDGGLRRAKFVEITSLGTPSRAFSTSTCALVLVPVPTES